MGEPVKNITPTLTDLTRDGLIITKGWEKGYPIYTMGKA
jgi:ABC-type thiamine transport system substrate-binding protein